MISKEDIKKCLPGTGDEDGAASVDLPELGPQLGKRVARTAGFFVICIH